MATCISHCLGTFPGFLSHLATYPFYLTVHRDNHIPKRFAKCKINTSARFQAEASVLVRVRLLQKRPLPVRRGVSREMNVSKPLELCSKYEWYFGSRSCSGDGVCLPLPRFRLRLIRRTAPRWGRLVMRHLPFSLSGYRDKHSIACFAKGITRGHSVSARCGPSPSLLVCVCPPHSRNVDWVVPTTGKALLWQGFQRVLVNASSKPSDMPLPLPTSGASGHEGSL